MCVYFQVLAATLEVLLKKGGSSLIDQRDEDEDVPLHLAFEAKYLYKDKWQKMSISHSQLLKAKLLIEAGASVNMRNFIGDTPLMMLVTLGDIKGDSPLEAVDVVKSMIIVLKEAKADFTVSNISGDTVIHMAARNQHPDVLTEVMRHMNMGSTDINARGSDRCTPLDSAVNSYQNPNKELRLKKLEILLNSGATFDTSDFNGFIARYSTEDISHVIHFMQDTKLINQDTLSDIGRSALCGCMFGLECSETVEKAKLLLQCGASVNIRDINGSTPLHIYCRFQSKESEIYRLLVEAGADIHAIDNFGRTPLHYSAMCEYSMDYTCTIKLLLKDGAAVNVKDRFGMTPLHLALKNGKDIIRRYLTENGADRSQPNNYGASCLDYENKYWYDDESSDDDEQTETERVDDSEILEDAETLKDAENLEYSENVEAAEILEDADTMDNAVLLDDAWWQKWEKIYWKSFPVENLISRKIISIGKLSRWVKRAREIRGDPDMFALRLMTAPGVGPTKQFQDDIIQAKIEVLITRLATAIASLDERFTSDIELSGSNREGTKVRTPNEFDYLFKFKHFAEEFEVNYLSRETPTKCKF